MADKTFVGVGQIYRAAADTAMPDHGSTLVGYATKLTAAGFALVGDVYSDGLNFSPSRESNDVSNWKGDTIRTITSSHNEEFAFSLTDWISEECQKAAFGDNKYSKSGSVGTTRFNSAPAADSAWCVVMTDGDKHTVIQVPRGNVSGIDGIAFVSDNITTVPITVKALKGTGEDTVIIHTMDATSSAGK